VGLLVALSLAVAGCYGGGPGFVPRDTAHLPLDAFVTVRVDTTGATVPVVRVEAPYLSLVFRRDGEAYVASLRAQVTVWDDGRQMGGGVASADVRVGNYAATRSTQRLCVEVPLVLRGTGRVQLDVESLVPGTSRVWRHHLELSPNAVAIMPVIIRDVDVHPAAGADGGHTVTAGDDTVTIGVHLRATGVTAWPTGGVRVTTILTGAGREQPDRVSLPLSPACAAADTTVHLVWSAASLPFGRTEVEVVLEAREADQLERLPFGPRRELLVLRVPLADDHAWRQHVGWLDGLVSAAAIDSLRQLPDDRRRDAWDATWTEIAASSGEEPALAETAHLRRVAEADDRYGQFGRGALSDRGRAHIRYGEPERVEQTIDDLSRTGVWEVWHYPSRNLRLVFYDANAINDFRLVEVRQD